MPSSASRAAKVFPPGRTLKSELAENNLSQKDFAQLIERPPQFVSELIRGKRELTPDTANRIAAALGGSASFWMRLEANYRAWLVTQDQNLAETYHRIRQRSTLAVAEEKRDY